MKRRTIDIEQYHDALARLSNVVDQRRQLIEALISITEHSREFGSIEDSETMLTHVKAKARAALRIAESTAIASAEIERGRRRLAA